MSLITNTSTAIMPMDRAFLSLLKVVLNYASAFKLRYCVSFAKARIKDILYNTIPSRYLPKQFRSLYIWCVKFNFRNRNISEVFSVL